MLLGLGAFMGKDGGLYVEDRVPIGDKRRRIVDRDACECQGIVLDGCLLSGDFVDVPGDDSLTRTRCGLSPTNFSRGSQRCRGSGSPGRQFLTRTWRAPRFSGTGG
jgi:hypothetical protein